MEQPVTIVLQDSERQPTTGTLKVTHLSAGARAWRALKTLLILWVVALGCIPLPGLHFVLVPGFFISGIVFAVLRGRASVTLDEQVLTCPKCDKPVPVEKGTTGWPAKVMCNECSSRMVMSPRDAAADAQRPTSS